MQKIIHNLDRCIVLLKSLNFSLAKCNSVCTLIIFIKEPFNEEKIMNMHAELERNKEFLFSLAKKIKCGPS